MAIDLLKKLRLPLILSLCLAAGAQSAWAQEVSGRGHGPGIDEEVVRGESASDEPVGEATLGEQARATEIVLPKTGGGPATDVLGLVLLGGGAAVAAAGFRLRRGRLAKNELS